MITFDALFLGRLGPDALAGVSLAFPFVMLIQHTAASGMGGGVSSAVARALGAGRRDTADALALHAFVLALSLGAGSLVLLAHLRSRRRSLVTLAFRGVSPRWGLFAEILKVGVPGLVNV